MALTGDFDPPSTNGCNVLFLDIYCLKLRHCYELNPQNEPVKFSGQCTESDPDSQPDLANQSRDHIAGVQVLQLCVLTYLEVMRCGLFPNTLYTRNIPENYFAGIKKTYIPVNL